MKIQDLMDAIGEVDEKFLQESERYSERPRILRKWAVSAASLLLLTSLVLIPIQNGSIGCASAQPPESHTHLFYDSIEDFVHEVGRDSLFANLSYESDAITDYEMECIYYPSGRYLESYYCAFRLKENRDVLIKLSYSDADTAPTDAPKTEICGYTVEITHPRENSTRLFFEAGLGGYTVTVSGEEHERIAMQIVEDLLTEE